MYYPFLSAQAALEQLRVRIVLQRHSVDLLRIRGRKSVESLGSLKSGVFAAYAWGRSPRSHSAQWLPQKEPWALSRRGLQENAPHSVPGPWFARAVLMAL